MDRLGKSNTDIFIECLYNKNKESIKIFINRMIEIFVLLSNKTEDWEYDSEKMCEMKSDDLLPLVNMLSVDIEKDKEEKI